MKPYKDFDYRHSAGVFFRQTGLKNRQTNKQTEPVLLAITETNIKKNSYLAPVWLQFESRVSSIQMESSHTSS